MAELSVYGRQLKSVFELLGHREDDITSSIGWCLAHSSSFLTEFLIEALGEAVDMSSVAIRLQEVLRQTGRTDIEISGAGFHIIIEAKRGWSLPGRNQLALYAKRLQIESLRQYVIIVMSECSEEYAALHLPEDIKGIPVKFMNWQRLARLTKSIARASHAERRLLEQLRIYLGRTVNMQKQESNKVYVVSLSREKPGASTISYLDVVTRKGVYFHPVGPGWPAEPPNYIAFRYDGKLQSIHHIESWKIIDDVHDAVPEFDPKKTRSWGPHFLYQLGPAILPPREVKTGRIYRSSRRWAMIDLLLTSETIYDAVKQTDARRRE